MGAGAAGAALFTPHFARAQSFGIGRALVGIYFFGGQESNFIGPLEAERKGRKSSSSDGGITIRSRGAKESFNLDGSLTALQESYSSNALAIVSRVPAPAMTVDGDAGAQMSRRYSSLAFLPEAFTAPAWCTAIAAGNGIFTFANGVSLVAPNGNVSGDSRDNPILLDAVAQTKPTRVSLPGTGIGSQLSAVLRLIQAGPSLGMTGQVCLCAVSGFTAGALQDNRRSQLVQEVAEAMAAFYAATEELGLASAVTTYTDSESLLGDRLVLGGGVLGGAVYGGLVSGSDSATLSQQYQAALAAWFGVTYADLPTLFPGLVTPPLQILA